MRAVGYRQPLPINESRALEDLELLDPRPHGRDLLVEVKAVSVNPVDTKLRRSTAPESGEAKVLGYDAAGVVVETGPEATLFKAGDAVWYSGVANRPGSNAELQLVDERIVGHRPASLSEPQAAAMPLTALTAWELLFDRLGVTPGKRMTGETLLVIGAAGGVGSILVQIAARLTGLTVIGTAARAESVRWVQSLGAHHIIDHGKPLSQELDRIGTGQVTHVASLTHTGDHLDEIIESLLPQGKLGLIDDPASLDANCFKRKSLSLHWEFMFARPLYQTADMIAQHRILDEVGQLVDAGVLRSTLAQHFGRINAENLKKAHALLESGKSRGKLVLEGFGN